MTGEQANNFYKQDKQEYNLNKNKTFLKWFRQIIKEGYKPYISIDELQNLINTITIWYEFKYPEKHFDYYDGIIYSNIEKLSNITKDLNIDQLLLRLNDEQNVLLNNEYTSYAGGNLLVYNKQKNIEEWVPEITLIIKRKDLNGKYFWEINNELREFYIYVNPKTGFTFENYDLEKLVNKKEININELYNLLKENKNLDITSIKECIKDHEIEKEIRNFILECIQLKLIFNNNTSFERGYERAKRFTNEFNKKLNCNLKTDTIDNLINKDYTKKLVR